jgi:hypothetical protein
VCLGKVGAVAAHEVSRFARNYGGAYAYGKTAVAAGYNAAGVSVKIHRKARSDWLALMPNAHEGYVSWEKAETIRKMVSSNVPTSRHHGAPKHCDALLAGAS